MMRYIHLRVRVAVVDVHLLCPRLRRRRKSPGEWTPGQWSAEPIAGDGPEGRH